tara:strand:+ start:4872 stop:5186 length:315 start_codon:yes stop_codon:yes gene_type:complete
MELAKSRDFIEIGVAFSPKLLESLFKTLVNVESVHSDKHRLLLFAGCTKDAALPLPHRHIRLYRNLRIKAVIWGIQGDTLLTKEEVSHTYCFDSPSYSTSSLIQ